MTIAYMIIDKNFRPLVSNAAVPVYYLKKVAESECKRLGGYKVIPVIIERTELKHSTIKKLTEEWEKINKKPNLKKW